MYKSLIKRLMNALCKCVQTNMDKTKHSLCQYLVTLDFFCLSRLCVIIKCSTWYFYVFY